MVSAWSDAVRVWGMLVSGEGCGGMLVSVECCCEGVGMLVSGEWGGVWSVLLG